MCKKCINNYYAFENLTSDRFFALGKVLGFKLSQQFKDNKNKYMICFHTKINESYKHISSVFENLVCKLRNVFKWSKHSNNNK